jgi:hypothetical protein
MMLRRVAIVAAALVVAACSSSSGEDATVGAVRMVNFTSETAQFRLGDSTFVLQPHEAAQAQAISLDAGQVLVTPASGSPIAIAIPARGDEPVLVVGARGHPPGSMPAAINFQLTDNLAFPQVGVTYVATSSAAANVDLFAAIAGASLGQAPTATAVNEVTFPLDAGVWQVVVRRTGTSEVLYRNPAVQLNTREPVAFFLVPRTGGGFEGVLLARNRTQVYPDLR